jgi:hypothetical protein
MVRLLDKHLTYAPEKNTGAASVALHHYAKSLMELRAKNPASLLFP